MKKLFYSVIAFSFIGSAAMAQDDAADKNVRFGLFVRGTPSWLTPDSKTNYQGNGARFGYGFGLNIEFALTNVAKLVTGIGGDFDGGNISYRHDATYSTGYILDANGSFVETQSKSYSSMPSGSKGYNLYQRTYKTTYVTIPLALKLMTKEISGFKYFGMFGANMGFLVKSSVNDVTDKGDENGINNIKDCNIFRAGLNLGLGAEYRLSGSTSFYLSANFVNSFISLTRSTSKYLATGYDLTNDRYISAQQTLKAGGVQINLGVLF